MDQARYYLASFSTGSRKTLRVRIGRARAGVTAAQARAALNGIIAANALDPAYGKLLGVEGLQYVTVTRTPLDVA